MPLSSAAERLFQDLARRLPATMGAHPASVHLNQNIGATYADIKSGRLVSFVVPGLRKRSVLGESVARLIAERYDAAQVAGVAKAADVSKATAAERARRQRKRLNPRAATTGGR
jgi:hypothetical protein